MIPTSACTCSVSLRFHESVATRIGEIPLQSAFPDNSRSVVLRHRAEFVDFPGGEVEVLLNSVHRDATRAITAEKSTVFARLPDARIEHFQGALRPYDRHRSELADFRPVRIAAPPARVHELTHAFGAQEHPRRVARDQVTANRHDPISKI